jgi:hypothetical protein
MTEDVDWLRAECEQRIEFTNPGFEVREIIPPATMLYDYMNGYIDEDGWLVFCDIGGQAKPGWDPEAGHGAIYRLSPHDELETIVPWGAAPMIMFPTRAPASYGSHGGELFFLGQTVPGRTGALLQHAVYRVPPGSHSPEVFALIPDSGTIGGGIAGALCLAGWGTDGSPEAGKMFVCSLMNCSIYEVTPEGLATVWAVCDEATAGTQFMPMFDGLFRAGGEWGDLEGELIVLGRARTSFEQTARSNFEPENVFFRVVGDGPERSLVQVPGRDISVLTACIAPEGFGPFGGQKFYNRPGSTNLLHVTKPPAGPLPYDACIMRVDADGEHHVFASRLHTTALIFQGDRMLIGSSRKSYSTGEFHYPDASLDEIRYAG